MDAYKALMAQAAGIAEGIQKMDELRQQRDAAEMAAAEKVSWAQMKKALFAAIPEELHNNLIVHPQPTDEWAKELRRWDLGDYERPVNGWESILWLYECSPILIKLERAMGPGKGDPVEWRVRGYRVAQAVGYFMAPYEMSGAEFMVGFKQYVAPPAYMFKKEDGRWIPAEEILQAIAQAMIQHKNLREMRFAEWWALRDDDWHRQAEETGRILERAHQILGELGVDVTEAEITQRCRSMRFWRAEDEMGMICEIPADQGNELSRAHALLEIAQEMQAAQRSAELSPEERVAQALGELIRSQVAELLDQALDERGVGL